MRGGQVQPRERRRRLLIAVYVACVLAPSIAVALGAAHVRGFYRGLSVYVAVIGLAMLFMQFALSGRFKFLSNYIGIDALMRFHQTAARVALGLLIAHPLLLVAPALWLHPALAARTLSTLLASDALRTGTTAWLLVILLVSIAIFRDPLPISYEAWRLSHGLGAIAVAGFGLHHVLSLGVSRSDPLSSDCCSS